MNTLIKSKTSQTPALPSTALQNTQQGSFTRPTREEAENAVRTLIAYLGEDPFRPGVMETPQRVVEAYEELYSGYGRHPAEILTPLMTDVDSQGEMILVRDIEFASHCEHHMTPFIGKAHIAYYPAKGVVGLSKLARLVDLYGRRLQTQETMTNQIIKALDAYVKPLGAAVMLEAEHMCMSMRGVAKSGAVTVTLRFSGCFEHDPSKQAQFLSLAREGRHLVR